MKDVPIIICPVCGQQYYMSEIFIPDSFFGKQKEIVKNDTGKIEFIIGSDMQLNEEYVCDNCGSPLKIRANVSFDVEAKTQEQFEEEFVRTFSSEDKLVLSETDLFTND